MTDHGLLYRQRSGIDENRKRYDFIPQFTCVRLVREQLNNYSMKLPTDSN